MPIFVLIFWLAVSGGHVTIVEADLVKTVESPTACANTNVLEAIATLKDSKENLAKGLMPAVVCAVPAPPKTAPKAPEPEKAPESNPGHGQWDNGPSGEL